MVNNNENRKGADEYDLLLHQSSHHECSVDNGDKIKKVQTKCCHTWLNFDRTISLCQPLHWHSRSRSTPRLSIPHSSTKSKILNFL